MQLQIEELSPIRKRVQITVPGADVDRGFKTIYQQLAGRSRLPGFRKGKVPMSHLRQRFQGQASADLIEQLAQDAWRLALDQHHLRPVSPPSVNAPGRPREGQPFNFSIEVEVSPDFEIKPYAELSVERVEWHASPEVVAREIEHVRERVAAWLPVEDRDVAQDGDQVTLDFKGSVDGVPFEGGSAENAPLVLGSGRFIPGFEAQIIGQKLGSDFEIAVTFPADYNSEELAGKAAVFACTLKGIETKRAPDVGPALAEALGEPDMAAVEATVKQQIESQHRQNTDNDAKAALKTALAAAYDFELPPSLLKAVVNDKQTDLLRDLVKGGQSQDEAREAVNARTEELTAKSTDELRVELALGAIADKEGIEVSGHEVSSLIEQIARGAGQFAMQVRAMYRDENRKASLRRQMRQEKVLDFLLDHAHVTVVKRDVPPQDHGPEGDAAPAAQD